MRQRILIAIGLVGLVLANLLTDLGLIWLIEERFHGSAWLDQIPIGVILGQLMTVSLWLGLGDGRWYLRIVVAVPLTFCIAKTIGIGELLTSRSHNNYDPDGAMVIAFMLLAMMLTASLLGFVLRRTRNWRLTWQRITSRPITSQFQVGDTLLWMIVLGGALAAIRFLMTIDRDFPSQLLDIGLYGAKTTAAVFGAMLAAFTTRRRLISLLLLSVFLLLIGAAFAVPDGWRNIQRMGASATIPATFYRYAIAWGQQTLKHEEFVVSVAVAGFANFVVLRLLGCRLVRPTVTTVSPLWETRNFSSGVPGALLSNPAPNTLADRRANVDAINRGCPKCGSRDVKLLGSRPQHNLMDPDAQRPPISTVSSYECQCGHAFAEATPHTTDELGNA